MLLKNKQAQLPTPFYARINYMNYLETIGYLQSQLPMFHRIGAAAYKANLDNTIALSEYLGNPEKRFRSIHIAGTNGKGSVANMLASVLQQQGYKTGLATSPHLRDFRERIRVNGKLIPKKEVVKFVQKHRSFFEKLHPSFFEISIALTFDYFASQNLDIAVIETGLGGRLDSTNILTPLVSVITNIGMDHMNLLGDTLEKIAGEKAGIIKPNVPVVIGKYQPEIHHVFAEKSFNQGTDLLLARDFYELSGAKTIEAEGKLVQELLFKTPSGQVKRYLSDLTGIYQQENAATVLTAIEVLNRQGSLMVSDKAIADGLARVMKNTGFKGRWYQIGRRPRIICDTGHNADGIKLVLQQLHAVEYDQLRMVIGMVDDKDVNAILKLFPEGAKYYFCKPDVPRGLDPQKLMQAANSAGLNGKAYLSVKEALAAAKNDAGNRDLIFVGGSTFVVAEVV